MPRSLRGTWLAVKQGEWELVLREEEQGGVILGKDNFLSPLVEPLSHGVHGKNGPSTQRLLWL